MICASLGDCAPGVDPRSAAGPKTQFGPPARFSIIEARAPPAEETRYEATSRRLRRFRIWQNLSPSCVTVHWVSSFGFRERVNELDHSLLLLVSALVEGGPTFPGDRRTGIVVMIADNDAGGITTYAATGAKFQYSLIWFRCSRRAGALDERRSRSFRRAYDE